MDVRLLVPSIVAGSSGSLASITVSPLIMEEWGGCRMHVGTVLEAGS